MLQVMTFPCTIEWVGLLAEGVVEYFMKRRDCWAMELHCIALHTYIEI